MPTSSLTEAPFQVFQVVVFNPKDGTVYASVTVTARSADSARDKHIRSVDLPADVTTDDIEVRVRPF